MVKQQQKLFKRKTYTPTDASQVCSPVVLALNKEDTLSEQDLKTLDNNLDGNPQSGKTERDLRVFVLNMRGKPLMPTTPRKARMLLKQNKAKVVSSKPFTLKLLISSGESKEIITLGIDSGAKFVGYSATTSKKELLVGELILRTNVSDKITERAMYRRNKRNKLWYRQPRFNNRVKSKKKGWLAPSIKHKIDTHKRLINKITKLLPVTKTIIEIANFDTQKLQDVDIQGVGYQQGQMAGYDNLRNFIFSRDKYTCQICKKKEGVFDIHHIIQRKDGGSDRPDNLVCVHNNCHKKFHAGKTKHVFTKPKQFKETVIMNNIYRKVATELGLDVTYGYITKRKRLNLELDKTHHNDAFVISGGVNQERCKVVITKQVRRNNRCLQLNRKGFKPSVRRQRYKIQPNDVVTYQGKNYLSKGSHCKGSRVMIDYNGKNKSVNKKLLEVKSYGKGIIIDTRQFLTTLKDGVSLTQTN